MLPYFFVFLLIAILGLINNDASSDTISKNKDKYSWIFIFFILILYVGLRHQVGGDWGNYLVNYYFVTDTLSEYLDVHGIRAVKDFSFVMINRFASGINGTIYLANMILAIMFIYFTIKFCKNNPRPWLGLLILSPYFINVVGMGYNRQAIAIAIFMMALIQLEKFNYTKFFLWMIFATTFHFSALFMFPLGFVNFFKVKKTILVALVISFSLIYYFLFHNMIKVTFVNFFSIGYSSSGAYVRALMSAAPAIILLIFQKRLLKDIKNILIWKWIAWLSIITFCVLPFIPSTAAVDRVGLYLIPIQVFTLTRLPNLFAKYNKSYYFIYLFIVFSYFIILSIWAYWGSFSHWWYPYDNILFKLI